MKTHLLKAGMAALGCTLAILAAMALGLENAASAGIITLLSLQNTKKETLVTALKRLAAYAAALVLAFACFSLFGYTLLAFGAYVLLFVLVCNLFSLQSAIAMCSVLIAHFWLAGAMGWRLVGNETLLLILGAGVGILLNLFLPRQIGAIRAAQRQTEEQIRQILSHMAQILTGTSISPQNSQSDPGAAVCPAPQARLQSVQAELARLEQTIAQAQKQAQSAVSNTLTADLRYYTDYIDMRRNQHAVLVRMDEAITQLRCLPGQAHPIAGLLGGIAASFHEYNNADALLAQAGEVRAAFGKSELPVTREEFEARAVLFGLLGDIEYFLLLKNTFARELTKEQKALFWSGRRG